MKHPIRRRLMYLSFQSLRALVKRLPLSVARAVGRQLGLLVYLLLREQRRLTQEHLRNALGQHLSPAERTRIARGVFRNLGQTAMEWFALPRLSAAQLQQLITGEGIDHIRQALSKGNGAIVVTAHFGNWELIAPYLLTLGFKGGVIARRLRYPEYESFLIDLRGARGIPTLARGSLKEVAKLLRANQIVGMLPDQDVDSLDGVFIEFFGRPAHTPIGPAALSVMTGAPILPCFIIREGSRFRLMVEAALIPPPTADREQAMMTLTEAWSRVVESYIRRYPDHWTWMHHRWKTQPQTSADSTQQLAHRAREELTLPTKTCQAASVASTVLCAVCCALCAGVWGGCARSGSAPDKRSAIEETTAAPAVVADPSAAQQMSEFKLTGYEVSGAKKWELAGQGASLDGNIVTIHRPDGVGYDVGRTAYLTASLAQIDQTTRHVRLEHDVTIHTADGLWFTTPVLHWIPDRDEMATDLPVRIETDHMLLRGRGASGLAQLKHVTIAEDIELVLNPSDADPAGHRPKQVFITCDGPLSFDYEHNIATFEQHVHVKDPSGDLYSDKLIAYLDGATHTIRYAEAIGRVRIHQEQNTALSERAMYEPSISKITLVGKPSLLIYPSEGSGPPSVSFGGLAAASDGGRAQ